MKIIISPAKTMVLREDYALKSTKLLFPVQTRELLTYLRSLSYTEAKTLWNCNDKIASLNVERLRDMDLHSAFMPAIYSYEGLQYQYLSVLTLEEADLRYLEEHLRILSGFYGVLKPSTGVWPYRLEMQAAIRYRQWTDLYGYWGDRILKELKKGGEKYILNLASKEYSKCVESHIDRKSPRIINVYFYERAGGKCRQKATLAKMARGEMLRRLAKERIEDEDIERMREWEILGFRFAPDLSSAFAFVYIKER